MRPLWIVPISAVAIAAGMTNAIAHRPQTLDLNAINGQPIEARIIDINHKDFSTTITATIQTKGFPKVLLTTRGCDYTVRSGDNLRFFCNLRPITNQGNPDEFDYAGSLWRKGIKYTQHLEEKPFHYHKERFFSDWIYRLRQKLETSVMATIDDPITQQLIIAMLLGDSRIIDQEMREDFSRAGIAHTLALSGLHVGIITWIIWLLLMPLDYLRMKKLRLALTLVVLTLFCVLTGLSPSTVRAALLIAISFMTFILFRRYSPINSLAVAALLILVFQPFQVFSIGFQLSFITVAALLLTFNYWNHRPKNRIFGYLITTIVVSLVAMLATMMITAYYFNTISFISPLTNLITLPLIPIVIVLGVVIIIMALLGVNVPLLHKAADASCHALQLTGQIMGDGNDGLHLSNVHISGITLVFYFVTLSLLAWWIFNRHKYILIGAVTSLVAMVLSQVYTTFSTPASGLIVFNDFKCTPILAFDHGKALLWIPDYDDDPQMLKADFMQHHRAFISHYRINTIAAVTTADTIISTMSVRPPFAMMDGLRIAAADDKLSTSIIASSNMKNDIIVIGRHFKEGSLQCSGTIIFTGAANTHLTDVKIPLEASHYHLATQGAYTHFD